MEIHIAFPTPCQSCRKETCFCFGLCFRWFEAGQFSFNILNHGVTKSQERVQIYLEKAVAKNICLAIEASRPIRIAWYDVSDIGHAASGPQGIDNEVFIGQPMRSVSHW